MDVALGKRHRSTLHCALRSGAQLFAVAHGFGNADRAEIEAVAFAALEQALRHAYPSQRALVHAVRAVNEGLARRYPAGDDSVEAACSMTAVLARGRTAWIAQAGTTAALALRGGEIDVIAYDDPFEEPGALPVLDRALGLNDANAVTFTRYDLRNCDALVLSTHRLRRVQDRARVMRLIGEARGPFAGDSQTLCVPSASLPDPASAAVRRVRRLGITLVGALVFAAGTCASSL